ncbi:type II and III secretion system protein family protein [Alicycliphilus sp. T452]
MITAPFPLHTALRLAGCLALLCQGVPALAQGRPASLPPPVPGQAALDADAAQDGAALRLAVGRQHVLQPMMALGRVAVGDPNVLDVKVLRSASAGASGAAELLLTPKTPGTTTLVAWPVQGQPQRWLVQVSSMGLVLERSLASVPSHAQAVAALRQSAPAQAPLLDRSEVAVHSNTVQVDVQVVEFKKSALRRAGINLVSGGPNSHGFSFGLYTPGGGISGGSSSGGGSDTSAISSAMNLVMNFGKAFGGNGLGAQLGVLEGNGLARVLARPTLVAHTGQNASFLAGGEIPIPVPSRDGNVAIRYKEFGVKLQLTPTILSDERIALKVAPEASDLDFTSGVTISGVSVPAVRVRRADTMVELADGESFIIGGLVSRQTTSSVNKVPLLGDLPVLGAFFKNLNYSQEDSELLIIVTPRLVHPLPAGTDLQTVLPGARSEQPNAGQVWQPFVAGGLQRQFALPGFSY